MCEPVDFVTIAEKLSLFGCCSVAMYQYYRLHSNSVYDTLPHLTSPRLSFTNTDTHTALPAQANTLRWLFFVQFGVFFHEFGGIWRDAREAANVCGNGAAVGYLPSCPAL